MPFKTWVVGEEVLAADFNSYVQRQTVSVFANAAARAAAITAPSAGMLCYLSDTYTIQVYNGTAWVNVPAGFPPAYGSVVASSGSVAATPLPIPGLAAGVTLPASRQVRVMCSMTVSQAGVSSLARVSVRDGSTVVAGGLVNIVATEFRTVTFGSVVALSGGAHTLIAYLATDLGTASVYAIPEAPSWISVEDFGA